MFFNAGDIFKYKYGQIISFLKTYPEISVHISTPISEVQNNEN